MLIWTVNFHLLARIYMKILNTLKKIAYSTALVFTVTIFVFCTVYTFFVDDASLTHTKAIPLSSYPWFLLFSLAVAALNHLLSSKLLPLLPKLAIHFVGVMAAISVFLLTILGLGQTNHGKLSVIMVLAVFYVIAMLLIFLVRTAFLRIVNALLAKEKTSDEKGGTSKE